MDPALQATPLFVNTFSAYSGMLANTPDSSVTLASITWPVASTAFYTPIYLPWPYPVKRVYYLQGSSPTAGTHIDFGIYTPDGSRIYSTGSTAQAAVAGACQFITPSPDFVLPPGTYYFALACDSVTANRVAGATNLSTDAQRLSGLLEQASALALPATATFASVTHSCNPFCGVTRTTTGF